MKSMVQTVAVQSSSQYSGHYDCEAKNKLGKKKQGVGGRGDVFWAEAQASMEWDQDLNTSKKSVNQHVIIQRKFGEAQYLG